MNKARLHKRDKIAGWGINDWPESISTVQSEYNVWASIIKRCLLKDKNRPTYADCEVCEEWQSFTSFYNWLHTNGWEKGLHVDKDILVDGNKVYSPDTCCVIPARVNTFLTTRNAARGAYPLGVSFDTNANKFKAVLTVNNKTKHLGLFTTAEAAEAAYLFHKSEAIKNIVEEYPLPKRVVDALFKRADELLTRSINITLKLRAA
jgi:hypothetical protein